MPTYEYHCDACGNDFEEFQSIKAPAIKKCPKCKKNKVRRLISAGAGIIFKGSGFYITDYRSEGYEKSAKADAAPTGDAAAKGDAKPTDAKPAESKPAETKAESTQTPAPAVESKPAPKVEKKASKSAKK